MKHRVRRNQLVIAGLAIMIAAAGYLNYSGKLLGGKNQSKETSSDLASGYFGGRSVGSKWRY